MALGTMHSCPICTEPMYLDPDAPHVLRCILKWAIEVRFGDGAWWRWVREVYPNSTLS